MKYELEVLDALIHHDLAPDNLKNHPLSNQQFEKWCTKVQSEVNRIKLLFKNKLFSIKREKQFEQYIQCHQQELIRLTDHLLQYISPEEALKIYSTSDEINPVNLYKIIYVQLEDLLTYIEKHFSQYFSLKAKIPRSYMIIAVRDFKEELPILKRELKEQGISQELNKVVFHPFEKLIISRNEECISFRKLIYLKTMLKELVDISFNNSTDKSIDEKVCCGMIYLNYNSFKFFNYCTSNFKDLYLKEDSLCGQIEKLAYFIKTLNQDHVKPGFAYKPKCISIKDALLEWLDEEMYFLEKRNQLSLNIPFKRKEPIHNDFKVLTSLSVSQLAYLVRLFFDTGIIINKNHREVLKFISMGTQTKRAENISVESMRSKFYNIEDSTRETIKDLIINILNQVRKN